MNSKGEAIYENKRLEKIVVVHWHHRRFEYLAVFFFVSDQMQKPSEVLKIRSLFNHDSMMAERWTQLFIRIRIYTNVANSTV